MSTMIEDDVQPGQVDARVVPSPLCDDDDEPARAELESMRDDASGEDVEGHGGGGFNEQS